ncbi:hemolysin III [Nematocida displodere]|uniref:Hemolysin III n=1 Tax=Nematocida displodere TaxID=1805483 RepID=A0A177ECF5_9MICR|nr:hemolysin III [Nematocida displodere]
METTQEASIVREVSQNLTSNELTPTETLTSEEDSACDESSSYLTAKIKPYWRGRLHRVAFYAALCMYAVLLFFMKNTNKIYLTIYFASQIILYGVSSTYHLTAWTSKQKEAFFRKLDHSSIFLLISGTQTCVAMAIKETCGPHAASAMTYVPLTYVIGGLGILKVFFLTTLPRYVNVLYYVLHGASAALFFPMKCFVEESVIGILCILGGAAYILGGAVYGAKKPDPWPETFGYHEVFHLLTIIGNLFFLLTVVWASYKGSA